MRHHQSLKETLIKLLESGPLEKVDLIRLARERTKATEQGVYKALRLLKNGEIITLHKKTASLSLAWIDEQCEIFKRTAETYQARARAGEFLRLGPGKRTTFRFRTLRELDVFWVHAFLILESQLPINAPTYAIAPHDWFSYMRPATDTVWTRRLETGRRFQGVVITHATELDRRMIKKRIVKHTEFAFNKSVLPTDERTYFNIVGPWTIEAILDAKINQRLIAFIHKHQTITPDEREELDTIADLRGRYVLKIANSPRWTEKVVRRIQKYFTFTLPSRTPRPEDHGGMGVSHQSNQDDATPGR